MKPFSKIIALLTIVIMWASFLAIAPVASAGFLRASSSIMEQTDALNANAGFDSSNNIENVISTVIGVILGLLGIVFLVLLVLGGYQWMTAGGNEDQVTKAQARIKTAVIGLVIVLAAYAITAFVFNNLPFATGGAGGGTPSQGN